MAATLLVALVGGFVFLGLSGFAPWAADDGSPSTEVPAGGEPTGGSGVEGSGSVGETTGDQTGSSVPGGSESENGGGEAGDGHTGSQAQGEAGAATGSSAGLSADEINQLISSSEATKTTTENFELGVQDTAAELVGRYQAQGDAALAHAGWLDMFGRCWGCVVVGPGWVDVCLVSGGDEAATAQTLRMEVEEWRHVYAGP